MSVSIKVQSLSPSAMIPRYMSVGASGCDVCACIEEPLTIAPRERVAVATGLKMEIPLGYEVQVRPRSGLSYKQGITVVNAPGTIDSDFRGEVKILLINLSNESVVINPGDRIAQFVLQAVEQIDWEQTDTLGETERAEGGFGSTGIVTPSPTNVATT